MLGSGIRRRAQFNILTILMAMVACAAFLGWWKTANTLRQAQVSVGEV